MKNKRVLSLVLLLLCTAPAASADAGTPLLWAEMGQLVFGNAIIAVFECLILVWLFNLPRAKTLLLILVGNYASSWIGFVLIQIRGDVSTDFSNVIPYTWYMIAITFAFTCVVEFPFVALAFRGNEHWLRKSLWGSAVIQTASYAVLIAIYGMLSQTSMLEVQRVDAKSMDLPSNVVVHFTAEDGVPARISLADLNVVKPAEKYTPLDEPQGRHAVRLAGTNPHLEFIRDNFAGFLVRGDYSNLMVETPFTRWRITCLMHLPTDKALFQLNEEQICIYDPKTRKLAILAKGSEPLAVVNAK